MLANILIETLSFLRVGTWCFSTLYLRACKVLPGKTKTVKILFAWRADTHCRS